MTKQLFQTDSTIKKFDAFVTETDPVNGIIVLDKTAFFPGGGGQPCDFGKLKTDTSVLDVLKVKRQGNQILHWVNGELPEIGVRIVGQLDWERRFQLMRTHSTFHVLCGVVWRDYGALVTGGNMEPLKGRMDFEFETLQQSLVKEIENTVNSEIEKARGINVNILPREQAFQIPDLIRTKINLLPEGIQEVRTVEIVGLDLQADGGTHVSNTKEIGRVRVVDYKSKGKINKRIYIKLEG